MYNKYIDLGGQHLKPIYGVKHTGINIWIEVRLSH